VRSRVARRSRSGDWDGDWDVGDLLAGVAGPEPHEIGCHRCVRRRSRSGRSGKMKNLVTMRLGD